MQQGTSIQSVERAMRLLLAVASRETNGSCKALAAAIGLATPTAHHLLGTLVVKGLLARDAHARYLLGPKIAVLASAFERERSVPEYLLAPLYQLAETTGETTSLSGWRDGNIHIFAMTDGNLPAGVSLPVEEPYRDAHARAAGRVLLAYAPDSLRQGYLSANPLRALTPRTIVDPGEFSTELGRVRAAGYAIEEEEFRSGVGCISVPVLHRGVLIGAYSALVPVTRFAQRHTDLIRALLSTSRTVERALAKGTGTPEAAATYAERSQVARKVRPGCGMGGWESSKLYARSRDHA